MADARLGEICGLAMRIVRPSALAAALALLPSSATGNGVPVRAAIASAHPLATEAGFEILRAGGNAFDAAVAVSAALAVVEPTSSGLGGGGFWLLHRAEDGRQTMIDGREVAPREAHAEMYLGPDGEPVAAFSRDGALAAGVPGTPAALEHIAERYGCLPLAQSLAPAIRLARTGFPVGERYRRLAGFRLSALRSFADSAAVFLHEGEVPPLGHRLVQADLAGTLERIAEAGAAGFYTGPFAVRLAEEVRRAGGIWSAQDLEDYRVVERAPDTFRYRGIRVVTASLPSSGGVVLGLTLNILERLPLETSDEIQRLHFIVEALRRAYKERALHLGDPDFVEVEVARLIGKEYARERAAEIDPRRATPSAVPESPETAPAGTETTHFSIVDAQGNRVAATLTINLPFGSAFLVPGTGVLLNDEMDDFSAKPLAPNAYGLIGLSANRIAPGKRPLSSMSPTFLETEDRIGVLGTPGGSRIISMVLLGILDFARGREPQSWVSRPRFHHQYLPDEVQFETGALSEEQRAGLRRLGHKLRDVGRRYGNMHAVLWEPGTGRLAAASDPRGEGEARVADVPTQASACPH